MTTVKVLLSGNKKKIIGSGKDEKLVTLTVRELEILKQISCGISNKEIAELLNISHRTVHTHRNNLMKKLRVKNVIGLLRFAYENKLIKK